MNEIYLSLVHMAVGYKGKALIRDIEIGVGRGEILTLIGPNGAGKSTILKTITRQLKPVAGEILLAEDNHPKNLEDYSPKDLARRMAVVLTGRLQTELMTCREVAAMGRYPYTGHLGILSDADMGKVEEALAAVHALDLAERPFEAVSDGERQRILLARAICQEPEMIVLDEPTSFLDIRHKLELLSILHTMAREQGITVVLSLHEIDLAMKISDRVVCVRDGGIFACGKPSEVLDDETVRRLYDLDPALGGFDTRTGSLQLHFAGKKPDAPLPVPGQETDYEIPRGIRASGICGKNPSHGRELQKETNGTVPFGIRIPRLMIAAPGSGSGKTLVTCGLLRLLQKKGMKPAAFKCGPDYIDPMFHRRVLQIPSRNLDTWFLPEAGPDRMPQPVSVSKASSADPASERCGDLSEDDILSARARARWSVREILAHAAEFHGAGIALIEGVMGYFDGTGPSGTLASSRELALQTQTPVVLVVNAKGMSRSVVPLLQGFLAGEKETNSGTAQGIGDSDARNESRSETKYGAPKSPESRAPEEKNCLRETKYVAPQDVSKSGICSKTRCREGEKARRIRGVILNRISAGMFPLLKKWIEEDTDLQVLGFVPQDEKLVWESRHLGLVRPEEISDFRQQIDDLAGIMEKTIDVEALLALADSAPPLETADTKNSNVCKSNACKSSAPRIAVASDEAFCFYYEDNLELLRECGADLVFFSPLHDSVLPAADGLLLGGGYPELYARSLSANEAMKALIRACAAAGMPILAECGGFMYLQESLEIGEQDGDGAALTCLPMCGILPGVCRRTDHLVRFGYLELENRIPAAADREEKKNRAGRQTGYLLDGHRIRGHEFHYFDSSQNGDACTAYKPGRKRSWNCMVVQGNITAGFPHLYYRSDPAFAARFVDRCRQYRR